MSKRKKLSFNVIFDTNILRSDPINTAVLKIYKRYSPRHDCGLSYFVPEVVRYELGKFFNDFVKRHASKYDTSSLKLNTLFGIKLRQIKLTTSDINRAYEKLLRKLKLTILETPAEKIDVKKLIVDAAMKNPPFEERGEKGFRDAIVALTIEKNIKQLTEKAEVIFVSNDENLRTFVFDSLGNKITAHATLPEFESDLKLRLEELDKEFAEEVTKEAARVFEPLYYSERIPQKIRAKYEHLFKEPSINELSGDLSVYLDRGNWEPIEAGKFSIRKPVFISRSKNMFVWETGVLFEQVFREKPPGSYVTVVVPREKDYVLEFSARWQAEVDEKRKFIDPELREIELKNKYVRERYRAATSTLEIPPSVSGATPSSRLEVVPTDFSTYVPCPFCGFPNPENLSICMDCGEVLPPKSSESESLK